MYLPTDRMAQLWLCRAGVFERGESSCSVSLGDILIGLYVDMFSLVAVTMFLVLNSNVVSVSLNS